MLQKILTLKSLNIVRPLTVSLVLLGFSVPTVNHAMEENSEKNSPKNLSVAMVFSKENEILSLQTKINDLSIDNGIDVEGENKPFLPLEILSKILLHVEQYTLIQADTVCHFFKTEGDRIWENRVLDLSGKLDEYTLGGRINLKNNSMLEGFIGSTHRFNRLKSLKALRSGRYKNACLQYCNFKTNFACNGDVDVLTTQNFKFLDLSHNDLSYNGMFCRSPIEFSESIVSLNLSNCKIYSSISISLGQLKELDLSHNSLSTISLTAPALKKLNLSDNYLDYEIRTHLKEAYKHLEVLILYPQQSKYPALVEPRIRREEYNLPTLLPADAQRYETVAERKHAILK